MLQETNPVQSLNRLFELKFFEQYGIKETYASKSMAHAKKLQNLYTKISPKTQVSWFDYFIIPFYQAEKLVQVKQFALTKRDMKVLNELEHLKAMKKIEDVESVGEFHRIIKDYSDAALRSEEHTSELQSRGHLVCRLLLEK